jgi:hypothetical protein
MGRNGLLALIVFGLLLGSYGLFVHESVQVEGLSAQSHSPALGHSQELNASHVGELPAVLAMPEGVESAGRRAAELSAEPNWIGAALAALDSTRGHRLEVTVVDGLGRPLPGALVEFFMGGLTPVAAVAPKGLPNPTFFTRPNVPMAARPTTRRALEGGKIVLHDVPLGELLVQAKGRTVFSPTLVEPYLVTGDGSLEVRIGSTLAIHGNVQLSVLAPLTLRLNQIFESGDSTSRGAGAGPLVATLTRHLSSEPFYFGGLEPGTYKLVVSSDICSSHEVQVRLPQEKGALDIRMFVSVDARVDVRYRSGRAPNAFDLLLVPRAAGSLERPKRPVTKHMVPSPDPGSRSETEVDLPEGRFLFEGVDPGEYFLQVVPRYAAQARTGRNQASLMKLEIPVTIPPSQEEYALVDLWLDEPAHLAVRFSFPVLGDFELPARSSVSAYLDGPRDGKQPSVRFVAYEELLTVVQGGELVLDLGPTFPGSYVLLVGVPDPRKNISTTVSMNSWGRNVQRVRVPSGGSFGGGGTRHLKPDERPELLEAPGNWTAPWKVTQLPFVLERGEVHRELVIELNPN